MLDNAFYIDDGDNSTTGWWALTQWSNNGGLGTAYTAGQIIRQSGTPTVGNERVYVCVITGTGGTGADPLTTFTRGVVIASGTATFQEATGVAALNGDQTNTPTWAQMRAASTTATLGQVIQRNNGASYQICTVQGTVSASEPAFSDTAGTPTTDNGATWRSLGTPSGYTTIFSAPHARIVNAMTSTWGAAGNSFYVHNTSAEAQITSVSWSCPGTTGSPCFLYSVTNGAVPPTNATLSAGASMTTTGNTQIAFNGGFLYVYGVTFSAATGVSSQNITFAANSDTGITLDTCVLKALGTNANISKISFGTTSAQIKSKAVLINTTMQFGATGDNVGLQACDFLWKNTATAIQGATLPTTLFAPQRSGNYVLQGIDLSALTGTIFGPGGTANGTFTAIVQDCKLNASTTLATVPNAWAGSRIFNVRSDSGNTNYNHGVVSYAGTQTIETTIVRTGGATDGTTPISWKIVPTTNSKWIQPFESIPITIFNSIVTPTTFTVTLFGVSTGGSVPDNATVWMDIEGLGTASFPLGTITTTTKASNLAAAGANSSDSSTWGGGTTPFKIVSSAITMQKAGYLNIYVKVVTSAGTPTIYIDPLVVLT